MPVMAVKQKHLVVSCLFILVTFVFVEDYFMVNKSFKSLSVFWMGPTGHQGSPVSDFKNVTSQRGITNEPNDLTGFQPIEAQSLPLVLIPSERTNEPNDSTGFQPIDNSEAWLYSAFYDHVSARHGRPLVRIFGVANLTFLTTVVCNFSQDGRYYNSSGQLVSLPESHGVEHPATRLDCDIPEEARPTHVSVTFEPDEPATNRLLIQYPGPRTRNFTVCYSVLHNNYNAAIMLIENIEMNLILGAEHLYVYNYSIGARVDKILRRYQEEGVLTVMPWPIPTLQSWYFVQLAAINDCIYRNRNVSRFVVVVDTDEFLIPRNQMTWMELIHKFSPEEKDVKALLNPSSGNTGERVTACFAVRSSYFFTDVNTNWTWLPSQDNFTEEEKSNLMKYSVLTLTQFWRQNATFPAWVRCKYIARPELIKEGGIHFVHTFVNRKHSCTTLGVRRSLLHHYRMRGVDNTTVMDTSMLKFKSILYPRLMSRFKAILW